jgi:cytochrome P450 family 9
MKILMLGRGLMEIDMKDAFSKYANDVIASSAFGIKVDSMSDPNNEFYQQGIAASNFMGFKVLKIFFMLSFPSLSRVE